MTCLAGPGVLAAICGGGEPLRQLVGEQPFIHVLDRGLEVEAPIEGCIERRSIAGWDVLEVPLDGPLPAVAAAARLLSGGATDRSILALSVPDRTPPPLESLGAVVASGLCAGVAVDRIQWVCPGWVWWTTRTGPTRLPLDLGSPTGRQRAALLLSAAREPDAIDPIERWLLAVSAGLAPPFDAEWADVLAARYLLIGALQVVQAWHG